MLLTKRFGTLALGATVLLTVAAGSANAVPVVVTDTQYQAVLTTPQLFNFSFTGLAPSDGTGGTFTVHARGDLGAQSTENITWTLETGGLAAGLHSQSLGQCANTGVCTQGAPLTATVWRVDADFEFTKTYVLSGAELNALLADGTIGVSVQQGSSVNSPDVLAQPFVQITFAYNTAAGGEVPLPAALPMFVAGAGLIGGLGLRRRRRKGPDAA